MESNKKIKFLNEHPASSVKIWILFKKIKIQWNKIKDKIEDGEADGTLSSIERKVEKFWDEFIAKRKMPDYFDIMVDMFMGGLPSEEYERLLKAAKSKKNERLIKH